MRAEEFAKLTASYNNGGNLVDAYEEIKSVMALAEQMNLCDIVRRNLDLSNKIRHLEIENQMLRQRN